MLVGLPDHFLRKVAKAELGTTLPALGKYAVGNVFVGMAGGREGGREGGNSETCEGSFF